MIPKDSIAIVGIGCRFPGANGVDRFWQLVRDGVDAITEVPKSRFDIDAVYDPTPKTAGRLVTRYGGFLDDIQRFDARFFGVSPPEAPKLDPQQRQLLEVSWEALEDAGVVLDRAPDARVGVFVGAFGSDYEHHLIGDPREFDLYSYVGTMRSSIPGRVSHALKLRGPSVVVDTACSSSLVATHLACQSLRTGEADVCLAAGVNVILIPEFPIAISGAGMLAPDGRCRSFDERASGFVASEGVGVVVLKRLERALADGDRIYAVIRGGAVNNDAGTAQFKTPSRTGHEDLLREAYRNAGVDPRDVQYVECHGTGTKVGDPVEVDAIAAVLGAGRSQPADRLVLGSVKTNIGHSEAAAGVAGVIKTALALYHDEIPPNLHFEQPSSKIRWDQQPVEVRRARGPWPRPDRRRIAGVNSFGISGINAHLVLEQSPRQAPASDSGSAQADPGSVLVPVTAEHELALTALARRLAEQLEREKPCLRDVAHTLALRRTHHAHRLAVVASTTAELAEQLKLVGSGAAAARTVAGRRSGGAAPGVVFVFPGQGGQWLGMGRGLYQSSPVFREVIDACAAAFKPFVDWDLIGELSADPSRSRLADIDVVQPAIFAVEVALSALWRSVGVRPSAVIGHSMGEVAAAHVAGALTLEDAARVICIRSRLLRRVVGKGAMAVVELPADEVARYIRGRERELAVAVINAPGSTVLSGDPQALQSVMRDLEAAGVFVRAVKVDVASHSPQVDELEHDLLQGLAPLAPRAAVTPFYSTAIPSFGSRKADGEELDGRYFWDNLRRPVQFAQAVRRALDAGQSIFVELSPHPVLSAALGQCIQHAEASGTAVTSMRRDEDERGAFLQGLATVFASGGTVDWSRVNPAGGEHVSLPSYPWQGEKHWIARRHPTAQASGAADRAAPHPLLGGGGWTVGGEDLTVWIGEISTSSLRGLADHQVQGRVLLPATSLMEMALAAAGLGGFGRGLHSLKFSRAVFVPADREPPHQLQLVLEAGIDGEARPFRIFVREAGTKEWELSAEGRVRAQSRACAALASEQVGPEAIRRRGLTERLTGSQHYQRAAVSGYDYGPAFRGIAEVWRRQGEAVIALDPKVMENTLSAAALDAVLQAFIPALPRGDTSTYVPAGLRSLSIHGDVRTAARAHALVHFDGRRPAESDILAFDSAGALVLEARGLRFERFAADGAERSVDRLLYEVAWREAAALTPPGRPSATVAGPSLQRWLILADDLGVGRHLARELKDRGHRAVLASAGRRSTDAYTRADLEHVTIRPSSPEDFERLLRDQTPPGRPPLTGIVDLWSLDASPMVAGARSGIADARRKGELAALHLVQAIAGNQHGAPPRLLLVTRGAWPINGGPASPLQAALWGFGRSVAYELPELRPGLIDLDPAAAVSSVSDLCDELLGESSEDQVALREGRRYAPRLVRTTDPARSARTPNDRPEGAGQGIGEAGRSPAAFSPSAGRGRVALRPTIEPKPGERQVCIDVQFSELNAAHAELGKHGRDAPVPFGCAGRVTAVGSSVSGVSVGDAVVAVTAGPIGRFVLADASLVRAQKAGSDAATLAGIISPAALAVYMLEELARVRQGERVLLHMPVGPEVLCAAQVARLAGARVAAFAVGDATAAALRGAGVDLVLNSRSDDLEASLKAEGIDVLIDGLAGALSERAALLLRPGARIIGLSGHGDRPVRARARNRGIFGVDFGSLVVLGADRAAASLERAWGLLADGRLASAPVELSSFQEIDAALAGVDKHRLSAVVIQNIAAPTVVAALTDSATEFRPDGTYLVTGGLGGLGRRTAEWLAEHGAGHIVLMQRRAVGPEAKPVLDAIRERGAVATVVRADVADEVSLAAALAQMRRELPPLRGIVHSAVVLADATLVKQTKGSFVQALAPKVEGSWNLHQATLDDPLDFFVMFSSVAGVLGNAGQCNYAAGNAFQDALAFDRRRSGRPAMSVSWGVWSDIGVLADTPDRVARLEEQGLRPMHSALSDGMLDVAFRAAGPHLIIADFDVDKWIAFHPMARSISMFAARERPAKVSAAAFDLQAVAALAPAARMAAIREWVREQLAQVLRVPASAIDAGTSFSRYGLDSLMAIQIKSRIEAGTGLKTTVKALVNGPTLDELAAALAGTVGKGKSVGPVDQAERPQAEPTWSVPLTDLQQAYWLGESSALPLGGVRAHFYLELDLEELDPGRLRAAWGRLVTRHPMLRAQMQPDGRLEFAPREPLHDPGPSQAGQFRVGCEAGRRSDAVSMPREEAQRSSRPEVAAAATGEVVQRLPSGGSGLPDLAFADLTVFDESERLDVLVRTRERMSQNGPSTSRGAPYELLLHRLPNGYSRLHLGIALLVCDGASVAVLLKDLETLYRQPEASLPPVSLQQQAIASARASEDAELAKAFWLERLETLPPAPELPLATDPAKLGPPRFVHRVHRIAADRWARFRARTERAKVTPTAAVAAAYAHAVGRWAKSPRFSLNMLCVPVARDVVGNFSSTLPLEVDAGAADTFLASARRMHDRISTDLEYRQFNGVQLAREMSRRDGRIHSGLPVVFVSVLGVNWREEGAASWQEKVIWNAVQTPQVWIDAQVYEQNGELVCSWDAVDDLFPPQMIERLFACYTRNLESLCEIDDRWGQPLPGEISGDELAIRSRVNATEGPLGDQTLCSLISARGEASPDRLAVVSGGLRLSHGDLARRARAVARQLVRSGVKPRSRVAVVMEKGWEQLVAAHAAHLAAAAYVPIDVALPRERLDYLLRNADVSAALTQARHSQQLEGCGRPVIAVDEVPPDLADGPALPTPPGPDELAYIIYTSGSTGQPKGVAISHRGAVNTILDVNRRMGIGEGDRVLGLSSLSFDLSVYDVFGPLSAGGAIVLPPPQASRDPAVWAALCRTEQVTLWNSVPALMAMLVEQLEAHPEEIPGGLRTVMLSGDWFPVPLIERIRRLWPKVEIFSLGGATEASIWSIVHHLAEPLAAGAASVPYGRPMTNQRFHVLDHLLEPRPEWVAGQLYIGGAGLAQGYWADPEKTRASFIVHPRTRERLYCTGDLGRYLPDGTIEFLGREDLQVKVQGYRIELSEIEAVLQQHPSVGAAAVSAGASRDARALVAYVASSTPEPIDRAGLAAFLGGKLPAYMVPVIVPVDRLPLSANGKIDRKALDAQAAHGPRAQARQAVYTAARSPLEVELVSLWEELLGARPIGVHDNFFERGGQSLLAVRMMARLFAKYGRDVPLSAVFERGTVADLAALLASGDAGPQRSLVVPIRTGSGMPLVFVHPSGGTVLCYRALAERLGLPFLGIEAPPATSAETSVPALAKSYLDAVQGVLKNQPFVLGGWSSGGILALEMARLVQESGAAAPLVVLVDSYAPALMPRLDEEGLAMAFLRDLAQGRELPAHEPRQSTSAPSPDWAERVATHALERGLLPRDLGTPNATRLLRIFRRILSATTAHEPSAYAGDVLLVRAHRPLYAGAGADPSLGWGRLLTRLQIVTVEGDHYSVVASEAGVGALAEALREPLARASSRTLAWSPPPEAPAQAELA